MVAFSGHSFNIGPYGKKCFKIFSSETIELDAMDSRNIVSKIQFISVIILKDICI